MTKHIDYKLLKHQKAFFNSVKPFSILLCGRGSGKTYCASLLAAVKLIQGERIMVFAQNFKSLSENLFSEILKRLDEIVPNQYTFYRQSMKLTFGNTGCLYGLSYENIDSARRFH